MRAEDSIAIRILVWAAMVWAILAVGWAANLWSASAVYFAAVSTGAVVSYRTRTRRSSFRRGLLLVALLGLAFAAMWADLLTAFAGGRYPQAQFGMAVQALTSFELKTRRNLLTTLVHSLLLLYLAADISFSLWLLLFLAGYGACAIAALVACTFEDVRRRSTTPVSFQPLLDSWGLWAAAGAATLLLAGSVFVLLPRLGSRQLLAASLLDLPLPRGMRGQIVTPLFPFVSLSSSGVSGAHPEMDLAYRGLPSSQTAMYVRSQVQSYWRGLAFDQYDGQTWQSTTQRSRARRRLQGEFTLDLPPSTQGGSDYVQTFLVMRDQADTLFTGYWARTVHYASPALFLMGDGTGDALQDIAPLPAGVSYSVLSRLPSIDPAGLRRQRSAFRDKRYTQLPALPQRVVDLAHEVTAGAETDYDRALALEHYLRSSYRYDLGIPPLPAGRDAVDVFLFDDRAGFCQQFATAMAVMGRSAGLATRVVTGYLPGHYDPVAGAFEVRLADAHSWVEVYFAGSGWIPFDPTPAGSANPRDRAATSWLMGTIGGLPVEGLDIALQPAVGTIAGSLGGLVDVAVILLAGVALALLLAALMAWLRRGRLRRRARPWWAARSDARARLLRSYHQLERSLARRGVAPRRQWETPQEHLARAATVLPASAADLQHAGIAVTAAAYDPREPTEATLAQFHATAARLRSG